MGGWGVEAPATARPRSRGRRGRGRLVTLERGRSVWANPAGAPCAPAAARSGPPCHAPVPLATFRALSSSLSALR